MKTYHAVRELLQKSIEVREQVAEYADVNNDKAETEVCKVFSL